MKVSSGISTYLEVGTRFFYEVKAEGYETVMSTVQDLLEPLSVEVDLVPLVTVTIVMSGSGGQVLGVVELVSEGYEQISDSITVASGSSVTVTVHAMTEGYQDYGPVTINPTEDTTITVTLEPST